MSDQRYLVDTNALSAIRRHRRSSTFFRSHCRIPDEVLHEARDFPDSHDLAPLRYEDSVAVITRVLLKLVLVMDSVPTNDTALVDLYANKGNADPMIVACALDAREQESNYLMPATWIIVTDDAAVQTAAEYFDLPFITSSAFKSVIDG